MFYDWFDCVQFDKNDEQQKEYHDPKLVESTYFDVKKSQSICELFLHYFGVFGKTNNTKMIYAGSSSRHYDHYQSPYATFKFLGEEICRMYRRVYKMNIEIARFYNVYGPHEITEGEWAAVIGIWRNQVKLGNPITIIGDGEQRRDFTHVDDIVMALESLISYNENNEDIWELGTGVNYSINEVASMFVERFDAKLKYVNDQPGNYRETLRKDNLSMDKLEFNPSDKLYRYIMSL